MCGSRPALSLAAVFAAFVASAFPAAGFADVHTVVVRDPFLSPSFYPEQIVINEGDTVSWTWDDSNMDEHDVRAGATPDNPPETYQDAFVSPLAITNMAFEFTFDRDFLNLYPATNNIYKYYCGPHWAQGMTGTVIVNRVPKNLQCTLQAFEVGGGSSETGSAACDVELNGDEDTVDFNCTHSVSGATNLEFRLGAVGEDGALICSFPAGGSTAVGSCAVSESEVEQMWSGRSYLLLKSSAKPAGALRGQIVHIGYSPSISGRVAFNSGLGVAAAAISAGDTATASLLDGSYELKDVPNGVYQLRGDKPGVKITAAGGLLLVNNATQSLKNLNAELDPSVGPGVDSDGDCVSDAQENADGSDPDDPGSYQEHVRTPVYSLWNGYIGLLNILELINKGGEDLPLTVKLYNIQGNLVHQFALVLAPRSQQDFIVNQMPGFTSDSYGVAAVEFSPAYDDLLDGRMFYYRQAGGTSEYEFAFGVPFVQPSCGPAYAAFNTYQPSLNPAEAENLVSQWLAVVNLDPADPKGFTLKRYNESGVEIDSQHIVVGPLARQDVEAGHVNPGTYRYGLNEVIPDDPEAPYLTQLFRYGGNSTPQYAPSTYSFAFPLLGRGGTARTLYAPISRGADGENWLEVTSTGSGTDEVRVSFYSNSGTLQHMQTLNLAPHSQLHLPASQYLAPGESGSAVIQSVSGGPLIAQSMFYFRNGQNSILSMYGSQAREALGRELFGSYNRYLGMSDWLRLFNTRSTEARLDLTVYNPTQAPYQQTIVLAPHTGVDLGLHEQQYLTQPDTYGIVQLNPDFVGDIAADVLRFKTGAGGSVDFAAPTAVR